MLYQSWSVHLGEDRSLGYCRSAKRCATYNDITYLFVRVGFSSHFELYSFFPRDSQRTADHLDQRRLARADYFELC